MKFGIFDHVEKRGEDIEAVYRSRVLVAQAADRAGFFCYHLAEHQATPLSLTPSPNLLLAQLAMATSRLRLGALCYILPLYDPLRLANEICMLDQLSGGRLEVGIGRGVSSIEMGFYSLDAGVSKEMFQENLALLLEALTCETLDFDGIRHHYHQVPVVLHPKQRPYPPFWYPTSGLDSIPWLAERRYNTVFQGSTAHVAAQVKLLRECLADPGALERMMYGKHVYVFVADTDAEATRFASPTYGLHMEHLNFLAQQRNSSLGLRRPNSVAEAVHDGWAVMGSPETVADQLAAILEQTGCNYVVFNPMLADTSEDLAVAQVELFADQVMPKFA